MAYINVEIEGNSSHQCLQGITLSELLNEVSPKNSGKVVAASVDGEVMDLTSSLENSSKVEFLTFDDPEGAQVYWHTSSHVLAHAVKRLYPDAQLGIGPSIENGFYYDFEFPEAISANDLEDIEAEMQKVIDEDIPLEKLIMERDEAEEFFRQKGEKFKLELIAELPPEEEVTCYREGEFIDLCRGPHLPSTGYVKAYKLTALAGAYWRGSENNPMLQRIYGVSFPDKKSLKKHLQLLEEAKKRDHRKLARELDLFSLHPEAPGCPFFHPNGMVIWHELENFWREEHRKAGYQEIRTPILLDCDLWKRSGHWDHYQENMYFSNLDEKDYAIKPMNCPGAMLIYLSQMRSYRDFPLRIAELGQVHRHELSGTLHGLMRVRSFTQDDAHLFMLPEQIEEEVGGIIDMIDRFYSVFGFDYKIELSTRPEKSMGSIEEWDKAISILKTVLENRNLDYMISEGEGAFYGPKIDFHLRDCLGRTWQCGTIQLDFQMPEKFDLTYVGSDGEKHRPVIIHRVIYGAMERFFALLIEHFAGAFPTWLAPVQVMVLPLTDDQHSHALELKDRLFNEGFRVEADLRSENLNKKIRDAQLQKIPYMLVVGEKEVESGRVAVRHRDEGDMGQVDKEDFINQLHTEINFRQLPDKMCT